MQTLLSEEKLQVLRRFAQESPRLGSLIEVGVFKGGGLLEICKASNGRKVYGFDTFSGMPKEFYKPDEFHKPGEFGQTSLESVKELVKEFKNVTVVKGVFPESAEGIWFEEGISFVHLDMDHWRGTVEALSFLWPKIVYGGIILFDDYDWPKCPGITSVAETWAKAKQCETLKPSKHQYLIYKRGN